ncbi:MAG: cysteine hydrolase [Clostridia bacterium]|nr:cysteine hydrolase [Clostridia bacterium]
MKKLLVIIDMVNGFINEGALADKKINSITPNIVEIVKKADEKGYAIIAFKDCHTENDIEFKKHQPHCIKGTTECELIPELKLLEDKFCVIEKNTTNGFLTPQFENLVNKNKYSKVYVTGCCTDIGVEDFVKSYLAFNRENDRKTEIILIENAITTFDSPDHSSSLAHKHSLARMIIRGAKLTHFNKMEKIKE